MTDSVTIVETEAVTALWRKHLGSHAHIDVDFIAAGGDSITALRLIRDIENKFDVEINFEALVDGITVAKLSSLIAAACAVADGQTRTADWVAL